MKQILTGKIADIKRIIPLIIFQLLPSLTISNTIFCASEKVMRMRAAAPITQLGAFSQYQQTLKEKFETAAQATQEEKNNHLLNAIENNNGINTAFWLNQGAQVHAKNIHGYDALMLHAVRGHNIFLRHLAINNDRMKKDNMYCYSVFQQALQAGNKNAIYILLKNKYLDRVEPLDQALRWKAYEIFKLILAYNPSEEALKKAYETTHWWSDQSAQYKNCKKLLYETMFERITKLLAEYSAINEQDKESAEKRTHLKQRLEILTKELAFTDIPDSKKRAVVHFWLDNNLLDKKTLRNKSSTFLKVAGQYNDVFLAHKLLKNGALPHRYNFKDRDLNNAEQVIKSAIKTRLSAKYGDTKRAFTHVSKKLGFRKQPIKALVNACIENINKDTIVEKGNALAFAARNNDVTLARVLIHFGADINTFDATGHNALMIAINNKSNDVVEYLLKHPKIDISATNKNGCTVLHLAASQNNPSNYIDLLLNHKNIGQIVNAKNKLGKTALALAIENKSEYYYIIHCVKSLINAGAIVHTEDFNGKTPLKEAMNIVSNEAATNNHVDQLYIAGVINPLMHREQLEKNITNELTAETNPFEYQKQPHNAVELIAQYLGGYESEDPQNNAARDKDARDDSPEDTLSDSEFSPTSDEFDSGSDTDFRANLDSHSDQEERKHQG